METGPEGPVLSFASRRRRVFTSQLLASMLLHLLHRLRLDLADALGGDAELVGELVQRARIATRASQRAWMMRRLRSSRLCSARRKALGLAASRPARARRAPTGPRRCRRGRRSGDTDVLAVVAATARAATSPPCRRCSISITSLSFTFSVCATCAISVGRERGAGRLHAAQVEEELALRLGGGDLHHPPVAQDVLVDLGLDPVDRERREPHAALGVEALHRLHQADVAFLDQVGLRQTVAHVVAGDGHHQAQVRHHHARAPRRGRCLRLRRRPSSSLPLGGEHRDGVHRLDVRLQAGNRRQGPEGSCWSFRGDSS